MHYISHFPTLTPAESSLTQDLLQRYTIKTFTLTDFPP